MLNTKFGSRGFTLIASLLMLLLLSGFALGLMMMVNTEQRVGGYDLNNNYTYHAAEGAIEKMTSDVGSNLRAEQQLSDLGFEHHLHHLQHRSHPDRLRSDSLLYRVARCEPQSHDCLGTGAVRPRCRPLRSDHSDHDERDRSARDG